MTTTRSYSLPDFLKVVAHETRWRMLTQLATSEYSIAELSIALREPQSIVAGHIQVLHDQGLITQRHSLSDEHIRYYSFDLEAVRTQYFQIGEALHPALFSSSLFPLIPVTAPSKPARVLFLCTENSARSQMAEALLASISHGTVEVVSAGSHPTQIHPYAIRALTAVGIDISQKKSKHVDQFLDQTFDRVITLCDRMHEACSHAPNDTNALHWSFPDPALVQGTEEQRYRAFEQTGLQLATRIRYLLIFLEQEKRMMECTTHLVIIGGSDAGISAALRARELNPTVQVTMIVADAFPNYSICGLPFYLSEEVPDWHMLAHRTEEEITREGIEIILNHRVIHIDPARHDITIIDDQQQLSQMSYDRLIIATGAASVLPRIAGIDLPGVFPLHTMADSFAVEHYLESMAPRSAVIIGGGYIGLEMADALTLRGLAVTVVEHNPTVLKTVDAGFGQMVATELEKHGVRVVPSVRIEGITRVEMHLEVRGTQQFSAQADIVLVAVGVRPATELAKKAGVVTKFHDAIRVTPRMETNLSDIYAAGDCVETWHRLLQAPTYLPLGTTSHKQGRVAGENAVGGHREFAGSLGTQVVKVFDLAIARTGLREDEAKQAGFASLTVESEFWDHKVYYPGAHQIRISLTGDQETGRLLGTQLIGHWQGEIAKRADIFATALFHHMKIEEMNDLDLSYTPPLSSPWDPVQMSAQAWLSTSRKLQKV